MHVSRRSFLKQTSAAAASLAWLGERQLHATPFGLPLGLQLYSVREQLPADYEGTLRQLAAMGYKEVEAAGFYGRDAAQVKSAMDNAGLRCVSAHYPYDTLSPQLDQIIEFGRKLGLGYIICSSPGHKQPVPAADWRDLSLDDWRWNAERFNRIGEKVHAAEMRFGYHNHTMEFAPREGVLPYDELLRLTDPALVTFEMDCGWVVVGGQDPAAYLRKYPDRISMLHVKDFKQVPPPGANAKSPEAAELGRGVIDYRPIFAAANKAAIRHVFVEQEGFDIPWQAALKVDAAYMQAL